MKPRYLFCSVVMMVLAGALIGAQAQDTPANPPAGPAGPVVGSPAPDFELKVLGGNGKTLQLSSLKGKAVLVSFWATWCEPCKFEMPWLVELQTQYGPQGLQVLGIALDDSPEKTIRDFARKMKVNYPILMGTEKIADFYGGVDALPMIVWVDREGKIVDRAMGLESKSRIEDAIKKSLGQGNSTAAAAK
jgi:thiol-disulfide isomerase/thioredoxin